MTWHADGSRTVWHAPDHLSVGVSAWRLIRANQSAWDGLILTLDTAGEYRYRLVDEGEFIVHFERIREPGHTCTEERS
jgi:hypothetical protein